MATASSMIISALVKNGEKSIGGTLTSAEQTAYLDMLNAMLESWSIDRTKVYQVVEENFTLSTSTRTYTIGSGGAFNTARPTRIVNAWIRDSDNYDHEVSVVGQDRYADILNKLDTGTWPNALYYDGAYAAGLATIALWPVPNEALTLYINSWKQLQSFSTVTHSTSLPPGYQRAIEFNFAIEAAPGVKSVQPEVIKIARESLAAIKGLNLPDVVMRMDSGIGYAQRGNILDGP